MKIRRLHNSTPCPAGRLAVVLALTVMGVVNARADYKSTVLADQPLAYYPLDLSVDTNTVATDVSGNGNDGTYVNIFSGFNNATGPSPFITNAVSFDGQTTYVDLSSGSNAASLNFGGQITMEAWVQPANSTEGPADILGKGPDSSQDLDEVEIRANGGNYTGGVYNNTRGQQGASGGTLNTKWAHIVCSYDGTNWNFYVNGALTQSNPDTVGAITFTDPWRIGSGSADYGSGRLFAGNITQVAMYNHFLTAAQVFNHYFIGTYGVPPASSRPIITAQPTPQVSHIGGSATFSVGVLSVLPVTNQWFKGGVRLVGQTNSSLVLTNVQASDVANYSVVVGNSNGTTNSVSAGLTLQPLSVYENTVINDQPAAYYPLDPTIDTGNFATDLSGNGNNATYVNSYAGFNSVAGPTTYITNAADFNGSLYADIGNLPLLNFSGPITMEAWAQPANSGIFGDILAKGYDASLNYAEITLRVNGPYGGNYFASSGSQGVSGGTENSNWAYVVLANDGQNTTLYVNGIQVQQVGDTSGSANFADAWRIGTGSADGSSRYFNGNISQVAIYKHGLSASQVFTHYFVAQYGVNPSNSVPIITVQPAPQSAFAGGSVQFSVSVLSLLPTTNQWFKGNTPIAGQTSSTLTLFNVQPGDAVNYHVVVGNANGTTNSANASLTLSTFTPPTVGASLQWSPNNNGGVWDVASSTNWINLASSQPAVFNNNDAVLFDDTAGVPLSVLLGATVSPSFITNNSSANNFVLSGSGAISGQASLVKSGSSTLELQTANSFTGPVTVNGGILQLDEPLSGASSGGATTFGATNGAPIYVTNGATLTINASGSYPAGNGGISDARQLVISGSGVSGSGAIVNIGNDIYHDSGGLFRLLRMSGDASIGGAGRWDLGQTGNFTSISTGGNSYNLTCLEGGYSEWHEVTIDPALSNIDFTVAAPNSWNVYGMGHSGLGNPAGTITLHPGVNLTIWHEVAGQDNGYAKIIHVQGNSQFSYRPSGGGGDYHLSTVLQLDDSASWNFYNGDGGAGTGVTMGGTVTLNGMTTLSTGNSPITFTNVISGSGGFVWQTYDHTVSFTANDTYSGPTVLCDGRTLALSGNGAISQSSLIFFGGTDSTSVRMDVSGRPDKTLTLVSGQTLGGIGRINGGLVVADGATISPAGTNVSLGITAGTSSTGTISATGSILLGGNSTTLLKLNGSGTNDAVQSISGPITYGGTLNLVNIGPPLAAGNSFQIFSAPNYSGSFTSITPATPGADLSWDLSQLGSGKLNVLSGSPRPVVSSIQISGNSIVLAGANGPFNAGFYVLTATNLTTPLANWTVLSTNSFSSVGAFNVTNAIPSGKPRGFYSIKLQ